MAGFIGEDDIWSEQQTDDLGAFLNFEPSGPLYKSLCKQHIISNQTVSEIPVNFASECQENLKQLYSHKISERNRRRSEGNHLNTLRSLIPFLKKKDKVSTLQGAIEFIKQLQDDIQKLQHDKKELELEANKSLIDDDEANKSSPRSNLTQDISNKMQLKINSGGFEQVFFTKLIRFLDNFGLDMDAIQGHVDSVVNITVQYKVGTNMKLPFYSQQELQKALDQI